ncbi:Beta-galactosidase (Lactase) [Metarhizium acridum]|uniref:Beta-galactosidase (Lactase) n=1 Tax=Metarhizium acridum TaxID=92637 RepID=UPI001C6C8781|nr:Beta-galactosidase (Lactase) [Metarhizium acridum]KAG8420054.1 Beta-galactosidase (Lactase) [Metarhizium acridum]
MNEPVQFEVGDGQVAVENCYNFSGLSHLAAKFKLEMFGEDAYSLASGTSDLPSVEPGSTTWVAFPNSVISFRRNKQVYLNFSVTLAYETSWATPDHEVAWF